MNEKDKLRLTNFINPLFYLPAEVVCEIAREEEKRRENEIERLKEDYKKAETSYERYRKHLKEILGE